MRSHFIRARTMAVLQTHNNHANTPSFTMPMCQGNSTTVTHDPASLYNYKDFICRVLENNPFTGGYGRHCTGL